MALSIKNPETEQLARQVAQITGESLTEAIQKSLQERMERLHRQQQGKSRQERIAEIIRRVRDLPVLDDRSPEEIIGYDEHGAPR